MAPKPNVFRHSHRRHTDETENHRWKLNLEKLKNNNGSGYRINNNGGYNNNNNIPQKTAAI